MAKYILRRIAIMIPVLLVVIILVFTITHFMPGDPVKTMLGQYYTEEQYYELSHELGLDLPFSVQLFNYFKNLVTKFDLGISYTSGRSVVSEISPRLGITLKVGFISCVISILIAIPMGIISVVKRNGILDYVVSFFSILIAALPNFWVALMLVILCCIKYQLLPATASSGSLLGYILPVICNSTMTLAVVTRQMRSSMLDVIGQDYIRTARAKGFSEWTVIMKHALKNAMLPILTILGSQFSMIIGGSVVIEQIFTIPGMGTKLVGSINGRDYTVVLGIVLIISTFNMFMILLVDICMSALDPRVKAQLSGAKGKRKRKKTAKSGTEAAK